MIEIPKRWLVVSFDALRQPGVQERIVVDSWIGEKWAYDHAIELSDNDSGKRYAVFAMVGYTDRTTRITDEGL